MQPPSTLIGPGTVTVTSMVLVAVPIAAEVVHPWSVAVSAAPGVGGGESDGAALDGPWMAPQAASIAAGTIRGASRKQRPRIGAGVTVSAWKPP